MCVCVCVCEIFKTFFFFIRFTFSRDCFTSFPAWIHFISLLPNCSGLKHPVLLTGVMRLDIFVLSLILDKRLLFTITIFFLLLHMIAAMSFSYIISIIEGTFLLYSPCRKFLCWKRKSYMQGGQCGENLELATAWVGKDMSVIMEGKNF